MPTPLFKLQYCSICSVVERRCAQSPLGSEHFAHDSTLEVRLCDAIRQRTVVAEGGVAVSHPAEEFVNVRADFAPILIP